jgi:hypothetical protein
MQYFFDLVSATSAQRYGVSCFELGVMVDPGPWYATAELFNTHDDALGHSQAWYIGGGYRIGKVTAYAALSQFEQTSIGSIGIAPLFDQKTRMVGLRWDFLKNVDAKVQLEQAQLGTPLGPASFINLQPGMRAGDKARVFSATVDFVW